MTALTASLTLGVGETIQDWWHQLPEICFGYKMTILF